MSEKVLTDKVIRHLKKLRDQGVPVFWFKIHGANMQKAGVPDLFVMIDGRAVFVELKVPGKNPSRLQEVRMEEIRSAGGTAEVARTLDDFTHLLARLQQGASND